MNEDAEKAAGVCPGSFFYDRKSKELNK